MPKMTPELDPRTDAELRAEYAHVEAYAALFKMFPDHPVELCKGVLRWKQFPVNPLFHAYADGNAMKIAFIEKEISLADWAKYNRDTGWSLSGYIDCIGVELGIIPDWDEEDED